MITGFLPSFPSRAVSLILLLGITAYHAFPKAELVPLAQPLSEAPNQFGEWVMVKETQLEQDVQDELKADDTLVRDYASPAARANLYIAYFKTQSSGVAPHSPRNCLPGSGWVATENDVQMIAIPGLAQPIEANRYIVSKGENRIVVMYWYQSARRVVASEYWAKFYTMVDSIRYRRSDAALVRVVVGIGPGGIETANQAAVSFTQAIFLPLRNFLPHS